MIGGLKFKFTHFIIDDEWMIGGFYWVSSL